MDKCEIKRNPLLASEFESLIASMDSSILDLRLSKPALRALVRLDIYSVADLKKVALMDLEKAHGIGPASILKLKPFFFELNSNFEYYL